MGLLEKAFAVLPRSQAPHMERPTFWGALVLWSALAGLLMVGKLPLGYKISATLDQFPDALVAFIGGPLSIGAFMVLTAYYLPRLAPELRLGLDKGGTILLAMCWVSFSVLTSVNWPATALFVGFTLSISVGCVAHYADLKRLEREGEERALNDEPDTAGR